MNSSTQVISHNPEALLAFTTLTTNNLLVCCNKNNDMDRLPPLNEFIQNIYQQKNIPCAVKLFTLMYLIRLKSKLPDNARGGHDTPYRLFLAAILTSSKYLSESGTGLTSMHLSWMTKHLYSQKEINRMERSFLGLLRYDLWVSNDEIQQFLKVYGGIVQIDYYQVELGRCSSGSNEDAANNNNKTATYPAA